MDPISIATTVAGVAQQCYSVISQFKDLVNRYRSASITISAICNESAVVNAALSQVEMLFREQSTAMAERADSRPYLMAALDTSLTGCTLLYSCLAAEAGDLLDQAATSRGTAGFSWQTKATVIWKEDTMKQLLDQIRGQVLALNLLLQSLSTETAFATRQLVQEQQLSVDQIKRDMRLLRSKYPDSTAPESVFGESVVASIYEDNSSRTGDEEFDFDDIVINSKAYRRALAVAQAQARNQGKKSGLEYSETDMTVDEAAHNVAGVPAQSQGNHPPMLTHRLPQISELGSRETHETDIALARLIQNEEHSSESTASETFSRRHSTPPTMLARSASPLSTHKWKAPELYHDPSWRAYHRINPFGLPAILSTDEWRSSFRLTRDQLKPTHLFQETWWELFQSERVFLRKLDFVLHNYRPQLCHRGVMANPDYFFNSVFRGWQEIRQVHEKELYQPLLHHWEKYGAWAPVCSKPFHNLLLRSFKLYEDLSTNYFYSDMRIRRELERNPVFRVFDDFMMNESWGERIPGPSRLQVPLVRIQNMSHLLNSLKGYATRKTGTMDADSDCLLTTTATELDNASNAIGDLVRICSKGLGRGDNMMWLSSFRKKLHPLSYMPGEFIHHTWALPYLAGPELDLDQEKRLMLYWKVLPCRWLPGHETWLVYHVVLLDNCLVFARQYPPKPTRAAMNIPQDEDWRTPAAEDGSLSVYRILTADSLRFPVDELDTLVVAPGKGNATAPTSDFGGVGESGEIQPGTTLFILTIDSYVEGDIDNLRFFLGSPDPEHLRSFRKSASIGDRFRDNGGYPNLPRPR